jgi:tetratricopeptide (TPR) repeat protein
MFDLRQIMAASLFAVFSNTWAQGVSECGDVNRVPYGPWDYTNPDHQEKLITVNENHFAPEVENLTKGQSSYIGGDLTYVLRASPNHHRALQSMANLAVKEKTQKPEGSEYTVECWFDRAMRFKPNDGMVRLVYGVHLNRIGKVDKALEQFIEADRLQPNNANINYNLGLLYFKKKEYEKARTHAKKAYGLGFPLPGLKDMLVKAGQWNEK